MYTLDKYGRPRLNGKYVKVDEIPKFIGVYADGTKFSRTYDASYCWVVKKDTELKFDEEE